MRPAFAHHAGGLAILHLCVCVVTVACAVVPSFARAQEESGRDRAASLATEANALYQHGRYEEAAVLLELAYTAYPNPALLYNLGQARDRAGDAPRAIDAFQRYLGSGSATDLERRDLEARIAELEESVRSTGDPEELDPPDETGRRAPRRPPPTREPPYGAIGLGSAAGAAVIVAIALGIVALETHRQSEDAPTAPDTLELHRTALDLATATNIFYGVGAAIGIAAAIWLAIDLSSEPAGRTTALRIGPGSLELQTTF
ncbi:MAG: tetratricopeptide repeat protein [Sandaracinaceae bacterium]